MPALSFLALEFSVVKCSILKLNPVILNSEFMNNLKRIYTSALLTHFEDGYVRA